jgi:hypothetical protein
MEFKAVNLRSDYEYLKIIVDLNDITPYWVISKAKGFKNNNSDGFKTLIGAKRFATQTIQNPKWGKEYPKLKYKES